MNASVLVVGGGLLVAGGYVYKLYRDSERLELEYKPRIHAMKGDRLQIGLEINMKNPSGTDFQIRRPFLKLLYQGTAIGTSNPDRDKVKIPSGETTKIDILIDVPFTSLAFLGLSVLKQLQTQDFEMQVEVDTQTVAEVFFLQIPLHYTDPITIKRKAE